MLKTDGQLVELTLKGDLTAYPELVGRYMNALYAFGYQMSGDFHLAQDIAQEALIKGYFRLSTLQDPDKFGSWLYVIARRTGMDWLRKNRRETPGLESVAELEEPGTIEDVVEKNQRRDAVWQALNQLSEPYREAAVLHFISGLTAPHIGRILEVTVSAVESRLRRAKQQLKKQLVGFAQVAFEEYRLGEAFRARITAILLQRLNCYYLPVSDPYMSALWYRDHFGLRSARPAEPGCTGVSLSIGSGMEIYLLKSGGGMSGLAKPHELLSFEVDDLELLTERLGSRGVRIETVERKSDRLLCRISDPDGHHFILTQRLG
jgi:RNA polymerase sigma-70 factor (ECF subfamily)